jgi:alkylation response protein AidB-like acyl-CoA dehydrogenase
MAAHRNQSFDRIITLLSPFNPFSHYSNPHAQLIPLYSHLQALQGLKVINRIADMVASTEAARLLTYQAARYLDKQKRDLIPRFCAMAKFVASDTAMKVTTDAVQVFGGYGYMKDYPVERMMRDAKLIQIYTGTNQIMRAVTAREIFKE